MGLDSRTLRRRLASAALFALLALIAMSLTQCQQVQDSLLGVRLASPAHERDHAANCLRKCTEAFEDSLEAEHRLHERAIDKCDHDFVCRAMEQIRHEAAVNRIKKGLKNCLNDCHHQGGGHGGGHD